MASHLRRGVARNPGAGEETSRCVSGNIIPKFRRIRGKLDRCIAFSAVSTVRPTDESDHSRRPPGWCCFHQLAGPAAAWLGGSEPVEQRQPGPNSNHTFLRFVVSLEHFSGHRD